MIKNLFVIELLFHDYIRKSEDSKPSNFDDFLIIRPDLDTAVTSGSPRTLNNNVNTY